jgi:hypothetical protein
MDKEAIVLNIYGPYVDKVNYWEKIFNVEFFRNENDIVGGDFNFSIGRV